MPTRREDQQLEHILQLSKSQAHPPVPPSSMRPSEPSTAPSHGNVPPTPGIAYSPSLVEPTLSSPSVDFHAGAVQSKSTRTPNDRGTITIRSPATGGTPLGGSFGWQSTGSTVRRELERGLDVWDGPGGEYRPPNVHGAAGAGGRTMVGSSLRFLNSSGGDSVAAAGAEQAPVAGAAVPDSEDESSSRPSSKKGSTSTGAADHSTSTIKSFTPTHPVGAVAAHNNTSTIDTTMSSHAGASVERVPGDVARRATESIQTTSSSGRAGSKGDASSSSAAAAGSTAAAGARAIGNGLLAPLPNFKRRTASTSDGPAQAPLPVTAAVAPVPSIAPAQPLASTSAVPATASDGAVKKARPKPKVRPPAPRSPASPGSALAGPEPAPARAPSPPLAVAAAGPSNAPASPSVLPRKKGASKTYSSKRDGVPPPLSRRKAAAALEKEERAQEKAREKEKTYKSRALLSDTDDSAVETVSAPRPTTNEVIELPSSSPAIVVAAPASKGKGKARDSGSGSADVGGVVRGDPIDLLPPRPPLASGDRGASSSSTSARKVVAALPPPPPTTHSTSNTKVASKGAPVPPAERRTSPRKKAATEKQQKRQPVEADSDATESEADEIRVERRPTPAQDASSAAKKRKGGAAQAAPAATEEPAPDKSSPLSPLFTQPDSPPVKAAPAGRKRPSAVVVSDGDSSDDDVPVAELALGAVASASSGSQGRSATSKKRRVVVESEDEADDEEEDDADAPVDVPPAPASAVERSSSKANAPAKKVAAKATASKAASAKSKRAAQPSPPPAREPRGLEGQPTVAVLGDTTDAETTDGRSPAKRARTTPATAAKGRGKAAQNATAAGKKAAAQTKGKGKAVETEDEDEENAGDEENVAPAPAPAPPSLAKPSPIKRVAAAASSSKPGGLRHGTPLGAAGSGTSSTPSFKIPRHMPPFKDMTARGGGVLIPPALGLAARPLSRLGSETPGSGVKLTSIVSRTAHLIVGGPPPTPTGQGASTSHATPSPTTAYKSRVSGLSRRGLSRTPLLSAIAPPPKRLAPAPVEKKRAKKGDLNQEDYSDGEWEEMEKERRRKERECDVWD